MKNDTLGRATGVKGPAEDAGPHGALAPAGAVAWDGAPFPPERLDLRVPPMMQS